MASLLDELALLAYDERTGRDRTSGRLDLGFSGAILYELAFAGRVGVPDGRVRVLDPAPTGSPLVEGALAAIGADKPRRPHAVVERIGKGFKRIVVDDLVARGVVRRERGKILGLFPFDRHFPQDRGVQADARRRIADAARAGRAFDDRTRALLALVGAVHADGTAFPDRAARPSRRALKAMGGDFWVGDAVRKAVSNRDTTAATAGT